VSVVKTPALSDKDVNVSEAFSFTESPLHKPKQQAKIEGFFKHFPGRQQSKGTCSEPSLPATVQTAQDTLCTTPKTPTAKKLPVAVFKKLEFSSSADSLSDWADMDDFDMSASDAFASLAKNPATRVSTAQKMKKTKRNFFKPPPRKANAVKTDLTPPSPECLQVDLTKESEEEEEEEEEAEGADCLSRDVICIDNDSASEELTEKDTQESQSLKAHLGAERGSHHLIFVSVLSNLKLSTGSSGTQDSCVLEGLTLCSAGLSSVTLDMKKVGPQRLRWKGRQAFPCVMS
jgi:bloom syndrome protein